MTAWAVYDISTGKIERIYNGPPEEALIQAQPGEGIVAIADGLDDESAYIATGVTEPQPKTEFPLSVSATQITADGIDECLITGVPAGTEVTWPDGQTDIVSDGEVAFAVDLPGEYILKFSAVPYLTQEVAIEAIPAT